MPKDYNKDLDGYVERHGKRILIIPMNYQIIHTLVSFIRINLINEHRSKKAGYDVSVIAKALDAFYSNYDNIQIPLLEALRIVSLAQDSKTEKADLYLLKAQKRYKY